jgi:pimeloyl-ACP methyl ester carboxylesterase
MHDPTVPAGGAAPGNAPGNAPETLAIAANGLQFHALAAGPRDGPLVLLLHGFPETSHGWRHQMPALAAAGLRVVAPDQRGYGLSSKPAGARAYTIGLLAADVVAIAQALGRARFQVVGHDWGGGVAWYLAVNRPAVVERAAILNAPHGDAFVSALRHDPAQRRRSWYMAFFQIPWLPEALLRARGHARLVRALVGSARPGAFDETDLAAYRAAWRQPGALAGMLAWYRALRFAGPELRSGRRRPHAPVDMPVRLIWGERDPFLVPALAEASITRCAHGELFRLPDATHWLHHEEPARVNALLVAFLREPATAPR